MFFFFLSLWRSCASTDSFRGEQFSANALLKERKKDIVHTVISREITSFLEFRDGRFIVEFYSYKIENG